MSLILQCDNETIGVVRNPYERIVSLYIQSLDYIGMDAWVDKSTPELQTVLYKDCDHIVRFEAWKEELNFQIYILKIHQFCRMKKCNLCGNVGIL